MALETLLTIIGVGASIIFSILAVRNSNKSYALQHEKFQKYETNCIATLNTKVEALEESDKRFRTDIKELFEGQQDIVKQLYKIKGKLGINGD